MNRSAVGNAAAAAETLRSLHSGPGLLVLPNAWDVASAKLVEAAGFAAIATTSGGVAGSLGFADHEGAPADEMLAAASRIIAAVSLPVTVDFEAGYGLEPREVVERLVAIGAAGFNYEDSDHKAGGLVDAEKQAGRIAALKEAAAATGANLVLNARVDSFIQRIGTPEEQLSEGLRRARLYHEAGADCIYPILLSDEAMIAQFVEDVGVININVRRGGPVSPARAAALGVRRVSYATSLFREAMTGLEQSLTEIRGSLAS
jgi:2-methylisocitrate lyase-like PEP mutase family enzyme